MLADDAGSIRIALLGGFGLTLPDGKQAEALGRKTVGLLAVLAATPGKRMTRERLAGLLWSNRDEELARNSLRQSLAVIRRILGPSLEDGLESGRSFVGLNGTSIRCDVSDFSAAIQGGQLSVALDLYRGPFLDGVHIRDPSFEEWSAAERRRLHDLYVDALEVQTEKEAGRDKVTLARRLVAADPLREKAHQLLIEALAETGARDEAFRQFRELRDLYERELGIGVSPETTSLMRSIERSPARLAAAASQSEARAPVSPSLAVHPIVSLSDDRTASQFSNALSGGLVTTLSKLPYLHVVAMQTSGQAAILPEDLVALDRASSADYMLEGHVTAVQERARVNIHLVHCKTGEYVFSQRHEVNLSDGFAAQDTITLKVAVAINVALLQGDQALSKLNKSNQLEPWELVLQASTLISSHDRVCSPAAYRCIQEAIRLDPNYGAAHTLLGWWHWAQAFAGWSADPAASVAASLSAALKGSELDPENPEPHVVKAIAHMQARDFDAAETALEKAKALGSNHAMVYAVAANVANFGGHPDAAIRLTEQAIRFCPVYPPWYAGDLAQSHLQLGQLTQSLSWSKAAIDRGAGYIHAHLFRVIALQELGRLDEAKESARTILQLDPAFQVGAWVAGQPFRDRSINARFADALRGAGLPDN